MHESVFVTDEVRPPTLTIHKLNDTLLVSPMTGIAFFFIWLSSRERYTKTAATWLQNGDLGAQNVLFTGSIDNVEKKYR